MAVFETLGSLGEYFQSRGGVSINVVDPGVPLMSLNERITGIWTTQPSVRKVVDFIARNVASVPFHVYERIDTTNRERVVDHPLVEAVNTPAPTKDGAPSATSFRFWHSVVVDMLLWDRWAAQKVKLSNGRIRLQRIPPRRFELATDGLDRVRVIKIQDDRGNAREHDPADFVWDAGYTDHHLKKGQAGTSPMYAIMHLLEESAEAVTYRRSVWRQGARIPAVILREAPWPNDEARERFKRSWGKFVKGGGGEGGTPVLEDGMKLQTIDAFKPRDTDDLEGRKLTDIEVASFYHIAPELVGAREGNYANMDAFRQMLYRDSLGPYISEVVQAINLHLTPELSGDKPLYVEAHLEAKLEGSFLEQAQVLQSATGAPWMTRAEARGRMNLPFLDGSDELVIPLNVLTGGQASPRDSGSQNLILASRDVSVKERLPEIYEQKAEKVLADFWGRQGQVIISKLGAKADDDWWDEERWDDELTDDLMVLALLLSTTAGRQALDRAGWDMSIYDEARTVNYLKEMSRGNAQRMNATTRKQLLEALKDVDPIGSVRHVFDIATSSRAKLAAIGLVTSYAAWGVLEAARQTKRKATKTWVTGYNPRPSHAALNGETVPIDETFSNGSMWPGDLADSEFGCNCSVGVNIL